jgi:hypothetical protein
MNRRSFVRKVIYLALIAVLLVPLSRLSQPATIVDPVRHNRPASPGGELAKLREQYKLSQGSLGQIDPVSQTMKLATFGLRPVAAALLWDRATKYQMKKDFTRMSAALEQLVHLQPNYVSVWVYQSDNLAFNVAHEWDDYRERYAWAIKGIEFLEQGIAYNENDPTLLSELGRMVSSKMGRSDEKVLFRPMFRDDDDFHRNQKYRQRDNWLFARECYLDAQRVVENLGATRIPKGPLVFYSQPVMATTNYAQALESDHELALDQASLDIGRRHLGVDGAHELAKRFAEIDHEYRDRIVSAWDEAISQWRQYGNREFIGTTGIAYRLNDLEATQEQVRKISQQLDAFQPGEMQALQNERLAKLTPEERRALETAPANRTEEQNKLVADVAPKVIVSYRDIAERVPVEHREEARKLADEAMRLDQKLIEIDNARHIFNYNYWTMRCDMERRDDTREARRLIHHASSRYRIDADLASRALFEDGFRRWRTIFDKYPKLLDDSHTTHAIVESIKLYQGVLKQRGEPFPDPFILRDVYEAETSGE